MTPDAPTEKLLQQIDSLENQANNLKRRRGVLSRMLEESLASRKKLNEEFQERKREIQAIKSKRDSLNLRVQDLKRRREDARGVIKKVKGELKGLLKEMGRMKGGPKGTYEKTRRELEGLEWRIQTTPLPPGEERALISRIAALESELSYHEKKRNLKERIVSLQKKLKALDEEANQYHNRLIEAVKESEVHHGDMLTLVEAATSVKEKADEAHRHFIESKKKIMEVQGQYLSLTSRIRELKKSLNKSFEKEAVKKRNEVKKRIAESAHEKLRRGEKLSFDEFKVLVEKGSI